MRKSEKKLNTPAATNCHYNIKKKDSVERLPCIQERLKIRVCRIDTNLTTTKTVTENYA